MDSETRADLDQTLGACRDDVRRGFARPHQGFGTRQQEFGTVREDLGIPRADFGELRREVRDGAVEPRRHLDVIAEDLRHDIRGIAEGVIALSGRGDRLGPGVRAEMNERFTATHAVVRVAFSDVRRDIAELRSRL